MQGMKLLIVVVVSLVIIVTDAGHPSQPQPPNKPPTAAPTTPTTRQPSTTEKEEESSEESDEVQANDMVDGLDVELTPLQSHTTSGDAFQLQIRADLDRVREDMNTRLRLQNKRITSLTNRLNRCIAVQAPSNNSCISRGNTGVTYIRWGKTVCNGDATILYEGYAAGSQADSNEAVGGGAELICIHKFPQWINVQPDLQGQSTLVGVQYNITGLPFRTTNDSTRSLLGNDMPCSVCHVQSRSNQIMIPGRRTCPVGWRQEYWGYLVSTHFSSSKGSYTCLDESPEVIRGGIRTGRAHLVVPVESQCDALRCPPYVSGNEITCVVCSK
jgi:hypothetical protein